MPPRKKPTTKSKPALGPTFVATGSYKMFGVTVLTVDDDGDIETGVLNLDDVVSTTDDEWNAFVEMVNQARHRAKEINPKAFNAPILQEQLKAIRNRGW
jgi:hypothetical protein